MKDTFSSDDASSVLEVLEDKEGRVVMEVEDGSHCDCAV